MSDVNRRRFYNCGSAAVLPAAARLASSVAAQGPQVRRRLTPLNLLFKVDG